MESVTAPIRHSLVDFKWSVANRSDAGGLNLIGSGGGGVGGGGGGGGGISGVGGVGSSIGGAGSNIAALQAGNIYSEMPHSPTPPLQRRLAKSFSVAPSSTHTKGAYVLILFLLFVNFL